MFEAIMLPVPITRKNSQNTNNYVGSSNAEKGKKIHIP
jgi:hypothetical protein